MKVKDKEKFNNPLKGWRILSAISSMVFHTVQWYNTIPCQSTHVKIDSHLLSDICGFSYLENLGGYFRSAPARRRYGECAGGLAGRLGLLPPPLTVHALLPPQQLPHVRPAGGRALLEARRPGQRVW